MCLCVCVCVCVCAETAQSPAHSVHLTAQSLVVVVSCTSNSCAQYGHLTILLSVLQHYVRQSELLSAAEEEFVLKRKQVALESLNSLGIKSTLVFLKKHYYGLKYVPLETESSIFEFELLNLNNCVKKLNLNHII